MLRAWSVAGATQLSNQPGHLPGKEHTMTKQDIRKAYTDQVAQLLNQGYTIFPDTMGREPGRDRTHRPDQRL